jgi:glycosyltransferase involved in cell wall biosynthesis
VFAGRLSPEKGVAEAVDIAAEAGVPVDVYGDAYDARYASQTIAPLAGRAGVRFHPAVPRASLWQVMARAGVVLFPALWDEPFGMVAAEAQACGTPVVAFRRGGLSEVIADEKTGFLVPPGDVHAAAAAVGRSAGISRSACRAHAESELDLNRSLDAHEHLYQRIVADAPEVARG